MERPFSTSKVTVEYFDPHDVYKLLAPGLVPRLPLRDLHWQSHAGPLRSIQTLHVELVAAGSGSDASRAAASPVISPKPHGSIADTTTSTDDGFTTQALGGRTGSIENIDAVTLPSGAVRPGQAPARRHQIPGLRRTPYLKVLLVRCDDNDTYKSTTRDEIRKWIKENTPPAQSTKKDRNTAENHDAFEWLIIHVVIPNTVASTQPRTTGASSSKGPDGSSDSLPTTKSTTRRWGGGSSTLLEKLRSDFNGTSKSAVDRVAQIRIGINDVPYDLLPRVVPAVPSGYTETEAEADAAWVDLIAKFKGLILSSFDMRVGQYEDDIKEKDAQRSLPGWNFCTFFILKEGLARGFESVGLVDDALVGYDQLSVGLDTIIQGQAGSDSAEAHGGSLLDFTDELKKAAQRCLAAATNGTLEFEGEDEPVNLQSKDGASLESFDDIPISASKKPYRDLILANNVSVFDFRCYIFARQISLLLRLGNAWSTRDELLTKLKEQQESVLHGVAPRAPPPKPSDEPEDLSMLAEICRRTLEFIPCVSHVMRKDITSALTEPDKRAGDEDPVKSLLLDPSMAEVVDNMVASFAFSIAQQILAQTSTKALPIPPSTIATPDGSEPKSSIPEPKTMMHPARTTSLHARPGERPRPPPSPGIFPGPRRRASVPELDAVQQQFLKVGLEELAARRAELYALSRNILEERGKRRGWTDGWASAPVISDSELGSFADVKLDDVETSDSQGKPAEVPSLSHHSISGLENKLLRTALDNREDFYRLYETLTDKALRHYTVANHTHSVQTNMADLAVLKFHLEDYAAAASYFYRSTPFFGESGWSILELSMLVMYAKCLHELQRRDEYARVVLKLLSKAAASEKDKLSHRKAFHSVLKPETEYPRMAAIQGFVADLLSSSTAVTTGIKAPLQNFFAALEIEGVPVYKDRQDSFSLSLKLRSLLVDDMPIDKVTMRITAPGSSSSKEIWLATNNPTTLKPGVNRIELHCNDVIPGIYEVDQIHLASSNMSLHYERDLRSSDDRSGGLKNPRIRLFQRTRSFDIRLSASKDIQLDQNNCLDIQLFTGWNDVTSCELRIRAATAGLRLLTSETKLLNSESQLSKPAEGGVFFFSSLPPDTTINIRCPFTIEHDMSNVSIKIEATYTTSNGSYTFSKMPSIPTGLALGVNVQDVFKHHALFSRFSVSTSSPSPLRLLKSELLESDLFESSFGIPPTQPVVIFPKQPASLLYKIIRKQGVYVDSQTKKTMYLKLHYTRFQDEIEALIKVSLDKSLNGTALETFAGLVVPEIVSHVQNSITGYDLERAALLGEMNTSFLSQIKWERLFFGIGQTSEGRDAASALASFIVNWVKQNPKLTLGQTRPVDEELRSIVIPVDIPSITIVHTADLRLQQPVSSPISSLDDTGDGAGAQTVCINQLLPATLHLKWTRIWDSEHTGAAHGAPSADDLEFSYEVSAPTDTWLLGGRRKGHFVIPAPSSEAEISSTPDTEADIPILLVPLREGWLPYPSIELREVRNVDMDGGESHAHGHCETDYRNLGETVRVVADRSRVTLSLDASGPGGGPLVLESERRSFVGRIVA